MTRHRAPSRRAFHPGGHRARRCLVPWLLAAAVLAQGCTTFRVEPGNDVSPVLLAGVPQGETPVQLVLDDAYRRFEASDSGHPLADSQLYVLGPALASLAESYLSRPFALAKDPDAAAGDPRAWRYRIEPQVLRFDNTIALGTLTQAIRIELGASVVDRDGVTRARATAVADQIYPMGRSEEIPAVERFVNEVAQRAWAQLATALWLEVAALEGKQIDDSRWPASAATSQRCGSLCDAAGPSASQPARFDEVDLQGYEDVVVYDFAMESEPIERPTTSERRLFESMGPTVADRLAGAIYDTEVFGTVRRLGGGGPSVLVVTGAVTEMDPGDSMARGLLGLGAGASGLELRVELRDGDTGLLLAREEVDRSSYILGGLVGVQMGLGHHLEVATAGIARELADSKQPGEPPCQDRDVTSAKLVGPGRETHCD